MPPRRTVPNLLTAPLRAGRAVGPAAALLLAALPGCGQQPPAEVAAAHLFAEDRPSVAVRSDGTGWVAVQVWEQGRDHIDLLPLDVVAEARRDGRFRLHASDTQVLGTAAAVDAAEVLHVVWSERVRDAPGAPGGWALRGTSLTPDAGPADPSEPPTPGTPGPVTTLVPAAGRHALWPALAADGAGALLLAWVELDGEAMALRAAARPAGGAWSAPVTVSDAPADSAWAPDVTASGPGAFALVWDAAADGDHDVELARLSLDAAGAPSVVARHRVTDTRRFEAHPTVAARGERLYVAYDVGPEDWGREGPLNRLEVALHESRRLEVVAIEGDRVAPLAVPVETALNAALADDAEQPRLAVDGAGNLVLFFRGLPLQSEYDDPTDPAFAERVRGQPGGRGYRAAVWYTYMTRFDGERWSLMGRDRRVLETSAGGLEAATALAALPGGGVAWATVGDGREQVDTVMVSALGDPSAQELRAQALWWWAPPSERPNLVSAGKLRKGADVGPLPVGEWRPLPAPRTASPRPGPPVRTLPDGRRAQLAFGDLHRHTDISRCSMNWDGSVLDALRYARGVGGLSFVAITDHFEHMTRYDWWRTQALCAAHDAPGRLVSLRAYERASAVDGHRNILSADDDVPLVAYPGYHVPGRDDALAEDAGELARALAGHRALAIPHTPAGMFHGSDVVADWETHEPSLDRLVEVFQGYRGSSEAAGAPLAIDGSAWQMVRPQFERGLHFGLIASSDHQSSDGSFAGAWVTGVTRGEVFEALHARRTFGSTVRASLWMEWGGVPMGTSAAAPPGPTPLRVEVDGLGLRVRAVDVVAGGRVVLSREVDAPSATLEFLLEVPAQGTAWAYVRAHFFGDDGLGDGRAEGGLAWSSPVRLGDGSESPDGLSGAQATERDGGAEAAWRDWRREHPDAGPGGELPPSGAAGAPDDAPGDGAAGDGADVDDADVDDADGAPGAPPDG